MTDGETSGVVVPQDREGGRMLGAGFFLFMLVVGVFVANSELVVFRILGWLFPLVGALVAFRYWTMRIAVEPEGLTIFQWPVRRFIPWVEVVGFETGPGNNITSNSRCIHVLTRNGRRVRSYAVQPSRDDAQDLTDALNTLRAALGGHRP